MSAGALRIPRRSFLRACGLTVGGVALGYYFPADAQRPTNEPGKPPGPKPVTGSQATEAQAAGLNPNVFIHIGPDGTVTIVCHRSEMGQGIRSSLPVLIADELGAQMARVKIVQADGDKAYGDQNTDGSNSIRGIYEDMRRVGATARVMLVATAAKRWNVRADGLCRAGSRRHPSPHRPRARVRRVSARGRQAESAGSEGCRASAGLRAHAPRQAVAAPRRARVCDRPGDLWRGHQDPGDAHRRHRTASGRWREGRAFRCHASVGGSRAFAK